MGRLQMGTTKTTFVSSWTKTEPSLVALPIFQKNYDLYLYNSSGGYITSSTNSGDTDETISYNATAGTTIYLLIRGATNDDWDCENAYRLEWSWNYVNNASYCQIPPGFYAYLDHTTTSYNSSGAVSRIRYGWDDSHNHHGQMLLRYEHSGPPSSISGATTDGLTNALIYNTDYYVWIEPRGFLWLW